MKSNDNVNSPAHYNQGDIECIQALEACSSPAEFQGYCRLNAMKYLWRSNYKGKRTEDLEKARWYINRLLENVEAVTREEEHKVLVQSTGGIYPWFNGTP